MVHAYTLTWCAAVISCESRVALDSECQLQSPSVEFSGENLASCEGGIRCKGHLHEYVIHIIIINSINVLNFYIEQKSTLETWITACDF